MFMGVLIIIVWPIVSFVGWLIMKRIVWGLKKQADVKDEIFQRQWWYWAFLTSYAAIGWPLIIYYLLYMPVYEPTLYGKATLRMTIDGTPVAIHRTVECKSMSKTRLPGPLVRTRVFYVPSVHRIAHTIDNGTHIMINAQQWCQRYRYLIDRKFMRAKHHPLKTIDEVINLKPTQLSIVLAKSSDNLSSVELYRGETVFNHPHSRVQNVSLSIQAIKKPAVIDRDEPRSWFFEKYYGPGYIDHRTKQPTKRVWGEYLYELPEESWENNDEILKLFSTLKSPLFLNEKTARKLCSSTQYSLGDCAIDVALTLPISTPDNLNYYSSLKSRPYIPVTIPPTEKTESRSNHYPNITIEGFSIAHVEHGGSHQLIMYPSQRRIFVIVRARFYMPIP